MCRLNLYTSNTIEYLATTLFDLLHQTPLPPMKKEIIVVPSGGMQNYLSFFFARKQQISANIEYPFPGAFISSVIKSISPKTILDVGAPINRFYYLCPGTTNEKGYNED